MNPRARAAYAAPTARVPRTVFGHAHEDGSAEFPPALTFGQIGEQHVLMPDNWNGLDGIYLWLLGGATEATTWNITVNIGSCDEAFNVHTQTVNGHAVNMVANEYECVDLTTIFATVLANLAARDMIQVLATLASGDGPHYDMGVELQET